MNEAKRTMPWGVDEYILIDGEKRVYSLVQGEVWVRLPGRISATVAMLSQAGHTITMPRSLRTTDFV